MQKLILLVEDEAAIAEPLQYALKREGWQVMWFSTATHALEALAQHRFDFIILDVGLPDMDGFELCRKIRQQWQTPLLFLTARNDEIERIIGIEIGADDYCGKPFSPKEIISRIKAIWRRMQLSAQVDISKNNPVLSSSALLNQSTIKEQLPDKEELSHSEVSNKQISDNQHLSNQDAQAKSTPSIQFGHWQVDLARYQIRYYGQLLLLTRYEFGLLVLLLQHPDQIFSRAQLMQQVWQHPDHSLERTVDTHIKSLRQKLKVAGQDDPIVTHRNLGYSLKL